MFIGDKTVGLFKVHGDLLALRNICPHRGGSLLGVMCCVSAELSELGKGIIAITRLI